MERMFTRHSRAVKDLPLFNGPHAWQFTDAIAGKIMGNAGRLQTIPISVIDEFYSPG